MQKINFQNLPSTSTPINATNLNTIQSNVEDVFNGDEPMGNIVVDSIRSKNMLNPSISISGAIASNSTSEATDGSSSAITSGWMPCKPNTTYTMSGGYNRSRWQSKAENGTITFISDNQTTITTNSTAKWIRVYFYYNSGGAINPTSITNVQVEEGNTATNYSPYQNLDNSIMTGSGIFDSTYVDSAEFNHWERSGNVVSYAFTIKAKGTWSTTTKFITGLPKPRTITRALGLIAYGNGSFFRFIINDDGSISNAYSVTAPSANQTVEGHITYITKD